MPQILVLAYTYEMPFGKGKALLNHGGVARMILAGWQLSAIQQYSVGKPVQLTANNGLPKYRRQRRRRSQSRIQTHDSHVFRKNVRSRSSSRFCGVRHGRVWPQSMRPLLRQDLQGYGRMGGWAQRSDLRKIPEGS